MRRHLFGRLAEHVRVPFQVTFQTLIAQTITVNEHVAHTPDLIQFGFGIHFVQQRFCGVLDDLALLADLLVHLVKVMRVLREETIVFAGQFRRLTLLLANHIAQRGVFATQTLHLGACLTVLVTVALERVTLDPCFLHGGAELVVRFNVLVDLTTNLREIVAVLDHVGPLAAPHFAPCLIEFTQLSDLLALLTRRIRVHRLERIRMVLAHLVE